MRSRDSRLRAEGVLRITGLVALALWIANAARPRVSPREDVRGGQLAAALPRLTRTAVDSVHVELDSVPDAATSAWLAAFRGAGVGVSWTARAIPPIAVETYAAADPSRATLVLASAPALSVVSDELGPVDTLPASARPAALRLAAVEGDITLHAGDQPARATVPLRGSPRRVFVAGGAGWESKFVVAALEESGWTVDARLFVGPGMDVLQGAAVRAGLDTSRHAAVVLLDSAAAEQVRGTVEFVRTGGGVVLAGDASRARRVASLVAWNAGKREAAPLGTLPGDSAWRGTSRIPLDTMTDRLAIALETRAGRPIVSARRHFAGRVIGVGYDQTWRWRMAGGENAPAEHRDWWSRIIAAVAATPVSTAHSAAGSAPLASLYHTLGAPAISPRAPPITWPAGLVSSLLGALCLVTLLAEWFSRRSRGAR
jgi:hypothetical protein